MSAIEVSGVFVTLVGDLIISFLCSNYKKSGGVLNIKSLCLR